MKVLGHEDRSSSRPAAPAARGQPPRRPACYRSSWQLAGPDFHRLATMSSRARKKTPWHDVTLSPLLCQAGQILGNQATARLRILFTVLFGRTDSGICAACHWHSAGYDQQDAEDSTPLITQVLRDRLGAERAADGQPHVPADRR
jgi:hypothetical protein